MCIPDGDVRAWVDGELPPARMEGIETHLAQCAGCRQRAEAMSERATMVGSAFAELAVGSAAQPDAAAALERFRARQQSVPVRRPLMSFWRPAWGLAAAAVLMSVTVSFGPTRAFAQKLLGLLRVKNVVVVPMQRDFIAEGKGKMLTEVLSDNITVTKDEKPRIVDTLAEASQLAGFSVRLPALRTDAPKITVQGAHAAHFTVNRARIDALLQVLGRPDLAIPEGLLDAKIAIDIPRGIEAVYGDCAAFKPGQGRPSNASLLTCLEVMQVPSPTVVTLPDLDLTAVAELGLQLSGMSPDEARDFSRSVDWASSLVIPLPKDGAEHETVTVDGVSGVLIRRHVRPNLPPGFFLVWVKNGMVYAVVGFGDPSTAVPLGDSLG